MSTVVDDTVNAPKDTVLSLLITRTDLTTAPTYQQVNMEAEIKKKKKAQSSGGECKQFHACAARSAGAPWPVQQGQLVSAHRCLKIYW